MVSVQPFGTRLFKGITRAHKQFVCKTIMVVDNDVDDAFRLLNRLMAKEGLIGIIRRTQRFETPTKQRARLGFEKCKAIYGEDMQRKVEFLSRKHRKDPYPGQY